MSRSCRFVVGENEDTARRIEQNQHLIESKLYKNSKTHGRMSNHIQVSIMTKPGTSCVHCRLFCLSAERTTDCNLGCFKRCFEKDAVLLLKQILTLKNLNSILFSGLLRGLPESPPSDN